MSDLILQPRISEKAINGAEKGVYIFDVPTSANKTEIARAVEARFKVKVAEVNTMITKGKVKMFRRHKGQEKDIKKAVVKLQKGQSIAMFEGAK
jgi:large subunit ribosomal protein L23